VVVEPDRGEGAETQPGIDEIDAASERDRLIEIRCGFAQLSRREADAAYARVSDAREAYYGQLAVVTSLTAAVNPEAMRMAKEAAHREFRERVGAARIRSDVEHAATAWLDEINRLNRGIRDDQARLKREREEAARLDGELDRLTATAEASRTLAETAEAACRAAQEGLVDEDLAAEGAATGSAPTVPFEAARLEPIAPDAPPPAAQPPIISPSSGPSPTNADPSSTPRAEPKVEYGGPRPPTIARLLRRDRSAMNRLVEALAGSDVDQRRRWQLLLSNFVDSVVAAAIDSGCLEFPDDNRFWNQFDRQQARDVARGLASLGFRYDGMSQFAEGRVPERRDLSIAVGQAGLHSVRIRFWPLPADAPGLMTNVRVDTDLLLTEEAPSFTMGEMVKLMGWRSELLADLWNEWPRLRKLLLAPTPV
jgi:hypothetical protein